MQVFDTSGNQGKQCHVSYEVFHSGNSAASIFSAKMLPFLDGIFSEL